MHLPQPTSQLEIVQNGCPPTWLQLLAVCRIWFGFPTFLKLVCPQVCCWLSMCWSVCHWLLTNIYHSYWRRKRDSCIGVRQHIPNIRNLNHMAHHILLVDLSSKFGHVFGKLLSDSNIILGGLLLLDHVSSHSQVAELDFLLQIFLWKFRIRKKASTAFSLNLTLVFLTAAWDFGKYPFTSNKSTNNQTSYSHKSKLQVIQTWLPRI